MPAQLVLKGTGSIYRQQAEMEKAQQKHSMKAPVSGAANSLPLHPKLPQLSAPHLKARAKLHVWTQTPPSTSIEILLIFNGFIEAYLMLINLLQSS